MQRFDDIVVGAGSAGCVRANRLSEDADARVLLLEAGGRDTDFRIHMPLAMRTLTYDSKLTWGFSTEPEPHCYGRRIPVPRGRVLGGSSSINGMIYVRGQPEDFDHWAQLGNRGWAWDDVLPFFKRSEDQVLSARDVVLRRDSRDVTVAGAPVELTSTEFDLLACFLEHPGIVLSRERLLDLVWGMTYPGGTRTVDVHVAQLRRKLGRAEGIRTIRGAGYKLIGAPPA